MSACSGVRGAVWEVVGMGGRGDAVTIRSETILRAGGGLAHQLRIRN